MPPIMPYFDLPWPLPPTRSKRFKMAGSDVLHIVLHILGSTRPSGFFLGPKSQFCQQKKPHLAVLD